MPALAIVVGVIIAGAIIVGSVPASTPGALPPSQANKNNGSAIHGVRNETICADREEATRVRVLWSTDVCMGNFR